MRVVTPLPQPLAVCGAGVVCARGRGWRGLGTALLEGETFVTSRGQDAGRSATGTAAALEAGRHAPVSDAVLAAAEGPTGGQKRKLRSRGARLAAVAMGDALAEAGWTDPEANQDLGAFLGVGSSGGKVADLAAVTRGSLADGALSLRRFGEVGLGAASPLWAFQLMNNFTLCHGAIEAGLGGPSSALFSRGGGTVLALQEAAWAILDGDCPRALAGGADTALDAVTHAELQRDGLLAAGLWLGEGAAVLALASTALAPLALLTACALLPCGDPCLGLDGRLTGPLPQSTLAAVDAALLGERAAPPDAVVLLGFSTALRAALQARARAVFPRARIIEIVSALGDALAGGPALAWAVALDLIESAVAGRVLTLSVGLDGEVGVVELQRGGR